MGCKPVLLNTPDGTVDLRSGDMRDHWPHDYFTKTTAIGPSTANQG
jgi:putative DNA primase/helicase